MIIKIELFNYLINWSLKKENLTSDLLNSLLLIRMNSLFLKQYGKDSYEFIGEELSRLFNED